MIADKKIMAKDVRALPAGSVVQLHFYNRRGLHDWKDYTVVKSGPRKKVMVEKGIGQRDRKELEIKDYPNKWYVLVKTGEKLRRT